MQVGSILIVDDEPPTLEALRQLLCADYPLIFARNGREALAAAAKHAPSLILLDIQMPDMNGYDVCRALKANAETEEVPVIFATSLSADWNEHFGFECGAVDYVVKPFSPFVVRARIKTHLSLVRATRLERSYRDAITMLGTAGCYNDTDTGVHIWRMAASAKALARLAGWDAERCDLLELASPMHDTGKIGVPGAILGKPGALDAKEWEIMKMHSRIGYEILSQSDAPVFRLAAEIALGHHEKWDGSGYPSGLSGLDIPESARIVAIADVFDALSMRRSYKDAWPIDRIVEAIGQDAGKHFDPHLAHLFLSHIDTFLCTKCEWDRAANQGETCLLGAQDQPYAFDVEHRPLPPPSICQFKQADKG